MAKSFWNNEIHVPMLKAMYTVSHIISHLPSVPQVAHRDFHDYVCNDAKNKPYIAFAPACPKGCMLLVWMKDKNVVNGKEYSCYFYIYIPCGSILFLPGNMVHAGGFSFGNVTGKEYSNQRIHFYICNGNGDDDAPLQDAKNGKNTIITCQNMCQNLDHFLSFNLA